jgi:hypothetical protein
MAAAAWLLAVASCSDRPEASGTNTNWLQRCDSSDECTAPATCRCGLCTRECDDESDCAPGVCGSSLASSDRCGGVESERLCLPIEPGASSCTEVPLLPVTELSAATNPMCNIAGALLCETFDTELPPEYSTWYSGTMNAAVQDCLVHTGGGALRYQSDAFGYAQTHMRLPAPVSSGPLHVRFFAYLPAALTIPDYLVMFELWQQDASDDGKISVEVIDNGALEVYLTPNDSAHATAGNTVLRDEWMCIELFLDVASADGSMALSLNGTRVIEQSGVVTRPANALSVAVVEGLPSPEATSVEFFIDDLVIATQAIGCQ